MFYHKYFVTIDFPAYPLATFGVPLGVRVPPVEYRWPIIMYAYIRVSLNNESWRSAPATLTTGSIHGKNKLCQRFLDLVNI